MECKDIKWLVPPELYSLSVPIFWNLLLLYRWDPSTSCCSARTYCHCQIPSWPWCWSCYTQWFRGNSSASFCWNWCGFSSCSSSLKHLLHIYVVNIISPPYLDKESTLSLSLFLSTHTRTHTHMHAHAYAHACTRIWTSFIYLFLA